MGVLPSDAIAKEIFALELTSQAILLNELADSVLEAQEGLKTLNLSSDATQWVKSLTIIETLSIIQVLAHSVQSNLIHEPISQKITENEQKIDALLADVSTFTDYRIEQGCENFPCGDMDVYSCAGECGWGDAA